MKLNSTKILILIIVCNLAALSGYYFLFQYIKTQSQKTSKLVSTISLGEQKNSHLGSLRSVVKDTEEKRQQLESLLLSGDTEIPFIEKIESLAKNSGLDAKTNSIVSVAGDTDAIKIFGMQMETDGSWSNTLYFLNQIENLPYDIRVLGVSVVKQQVGDKVVSNSWNAKFDISVIEKI